VVSGSLLFNGETLFFVDEPSSGDGDARPDHRQQWDERQEDGYHVLHRRSLSTLVRPKIRARDAKGFSRMNGFIFAVRWNLGTMK